MKSSRQSLSYVSSSRMSINVGLSKKSKHRKSKEKLPDTSQFLKPQKKATKE